MTQPDQPPAPVDTLWGDNPPDGPCAICGDARDHDGRPHSEAVGDGRIRADIPVIVDGGTGPAGDAPHILDADGACLEACPHEIHDGPVLVAMDTRLKAMLDDWISDLDLSSEYVPTAPDDERLRTYMVVIPPDHALNRANQLLGALKPRAAERGTRRGAR